MIDSTAFVLEACVFTAACVVFFLFVWTVWAFIAAYRLYVRVLAARDTGGIHCPHTGRMLMHRPFHVPYACAHLYTVCALKQK